MDEPTLRCLEARCLMPLEPMGAEVIHSLREHERVSQVVLARHLNVTTGLVSPWERGEKRPSGASLKLLTLARQNGPVATA